MSSQRRATCPDVTDYGRRPSVAWGPVGWRKVETLEGLFKHLARRAARTRIQCGDINTPQAERADGTVITFRQVLGDDGQVSGRRRRQVGPGER